MQWSDVRSYLDTLPQSAQRKRLTGDLQRTPSVRQSLVRIAASYSSVELTCRLGPHIIVLRFPPKYPFSGVLFEVDVPHTPHAQELARSGLPSGVKEAIAVYLRHRRRLSLKQFLYEQHRRRSGEAAAVHVLEYCTAHLSPHCWSPSTPLRRQWEQVEQLLGELGAAPH
jgi:hypothetical protein